MKSLVLSDLHANLAALESVLAQGRWRDEIIFLGDAIGSGPEPDAVLRRLSTQPGIWIRGNHDLEPFYRDYGAEQKSLDQRYQLWTRDQVSPDMRAFLESFEKTRVVEREGITIRLHHGDFARALLSPKTNGWASWLRPSGRSKLLRRLHRRLFGAPDKYLWPDSDPAIFRTVATAFPEPIILFGDSHVQFRAEIDGRSFVPPGSVGQPRLGKPLASYAVLQDGEIRLEAVSYDVESTCRAMDALPLDRTFVEAWKAGYRAGRLPRRYRIRDWRPLIASGYR